MAIKLAIVFLLFFGEAASENEQPCQTPSGEQAKCVDLDSCPILLNLINRKPTGELQLYLIRSICNHEGKMQICCPSVLNATAFNEVASKHETTKIQHLDRVNCGHRNEEVADLYYHPWLCVVTLEYWHLCSCALINARYVLTTADCVHRYISPTAGINMLISFGDFIQNSEKNCTVVTEDNINDCSFREDFEIEDSIAHPFYDLMRFGNNNIGLIRLKKTVEYKDYIRPICLPSLDTPAAQPGDTLYMYGWGIFSEESTESLRMKHRVPVILLTNEQCKEEVRNAEHAIPRGSMCMAKNKNYTRKVVLGETGGAIINPVNQWHMEGLSLSYNKPLLYVRIITYLKWIESNIQP